MAVGDRLQIADKPTLDLTKADTTEILERIGESGGGTGDSVVEMLQTLLNTPKIIRHIQRGVFSSVTGLTSVITVQLAGFTNVDKMVVIPQIMDELTAWRPQSFTVTTQSFTIQGAGSQRGWSIYQVIEFY